MNDIQEFQTKLYKLLKEYKATISFECGDASDTYGIFDARMEVRIGKESFRLEDGWSISN